MSRSAPPAARRRHKGRWSKKRSVGGKRSAQEKNCCRRMRRKKRYLSCASVAACGMSLKKKGRSPCGSGPSLGRKRPRRATVTREHLSLPHCNNIHRVAQNASTVDPIVPHFTQNFLHFLQSRSTRAVPRHPLEFTINCRNIRRLIHSEKRFCTCVKFRQDSQKRRLGRGLNAIQVIAVICRTHSRAPFRPLTNCPRWLERVSLKPLSFDPKP